MGNLIIGVVVVGRMGTALLARTPARTALRPHCHQVKGVPNVVIVVLGMVRVPVLSMKRTRTVLLTLQVSLQRLPYLLDSLFHCVLMNFGHGV
jgi:hypothetical protein